MEPFVRNRTFVLLVFLLVLILWLLYLYFRNKFSETFLFEKNYPSSWNQGMVVHLSKKDNRSHYTESSTPLPKNSAQGEASCQALCHKQVECNDRGQDWKNTCAPYFASDDCYCPFQKTTEGFEANNFAKRIFNKMCTELQTCQSWPQTSGSWDTNKCTPIVRKDAFKDSTGQTVVWQDMGIDNINNMAVSFWIYFNSHLGQTRPVTSIFDFTIDGKTYFGVYAYGANPTLSIRGLGDNGVIVDDQEFATTSYLVGGNDIGYTPDPVFVVISITEGVYKFYRDGDLKNTHGSEMFTNPPAETPLRSGMPLDESDTTTAEFQGISIKDFRVYNHPIKNHDVKSLYSQIRSTGHDRTCEAASYQNADGAFYETSDIGITDYISRIKNAIVEGFTSRQEIAIIGDDLLSMTSSDNGQTTDSLVYVSTRNPSGNTGQTCNRNDGEPFRANNQKSPFHDTVNIYKAYLQYTPYDSPSNVRSMDMTNEVQAVLQGIKTELVNVDFDNTYVRSLEIHTIHPWTRTESKFTVPYDRTQSNIWWNKREDRFNWEKLIERVKCINSDDKKWNEQTNRCVDDNLNKVCARDTRCFGFISGVQEGVCSRDGALDIKQTSVMLPGGVERKLHYTIVKEGDHLRADVNTKPDGFKPTLFSSRGTTFVMWFQIPAGMRGTDAKNEHLCRLLHFGNAKGKYIEDEVSIAVGTDFTTDTLQFRVDNTTLDIATDGQLTNKDWTQESGTNAKGSQVMDNKWHHLAWVLNPPAGKVSSWTVYHNGKPLGAIANDPIQAYPVQKERTHRLVGGSASNNDESWGPNIGDFRIYDKTLTLTEVENIYLGKS